MSDKVKVLIIGLTCRLYCGNLRSEGRTGPVLYTGGQPGGQLLQPMMWKTFPVTRRVLLPQMMIDLQKQAERFGTKVNYGLVTR